MIQYQKNKLSTFEAVHAYLEKNSSVFNNIEEFVNIQNAFTSKIQDIAAKEDERMNATKGKTLDKNVTRKSVTSIALVVAGALYAFGKKTNNVPLTEKANITISKLDGLRNAELAITLNSIKGLIVDNVQALIGYGLSQERLASFESKIDIYVAALKSKQSSDAQKTGANKILTNLFKEASVILDSIDKLAEGFREDNVQFYKGYKAARVFKNLGIRHRPTPEPVQQTPEVKTEPEKLPDATTGKPNPLPPERSGEVPPVKL